MGCDGCAPCGRCGHPLKWHSGTESPGCWQYVKRHLEAADGVEWDRRSPCPCEGYIPKEDIMTEARIIRFPRGDAR